VKDVGRGGNRAYCKYRSGRNLERYKQLRNEVNRAIRQEEDEERKQLLAGFEHSPKSFLVTCVADSQG